ncbi:MAG: hypothetical protein GXP46_12975 [Deferribacteres bacterium]|nr:hypothetical protein [Deferribacteres bacterium]
MVDSLRNGDVEMLRRGAIRFAYLTYSPVRPFSASQKGWYDQALTRTGEGE